MTKRQSVSAKPPQPGADRKPESTQSRLEPGYLQMQITQNVEFYNFGSKTKMVTGRSLEQIVAEAKAGMNLYSFSELRAMHKEKKEALELLHFFPNKETFEQLRSFLSK